VAGEAAAEEADAAAEEAEPEWVGAAGCRVRRRRWVVRLRLAAVRDQAVACRGPREARRAPLAESAVVAVVLEESALVALVQAVWAGADQSVGRHHQALHRARDRARLILAADGQAASAALVLD
jgi:hypothetical protein